jgi:hypothetical protein
MLASLSTCAAAERRYCRRMTTVAAAVLVAAFAAVSVLSGLIVVRLYRGDG